MRIRKQYRVLMIEGSEVKIEGNDYIFFADESDYTSLSENATFRKPAFHILEWKTITEELETKNGEKLLVTKTVPVRTAFFAVYKVAKNGISSKEQAKLEARAKRILEKGLVIQFPDGTRKRYMRVMRSASQYRTAKFLMTEDSLVKTVREAVTYGWVNSFINRKDVNVAKVEPYLSLASTSSLSAGYGWTSIDIDDTDCWVDVTDSVSVDNEKVVKYADYLINDDSKVEGKDWKIEDGKVYASMELTDGQAMMSPLAGARIAMRVEQISVRQYRMIRRAFKAGITFSEQLKHPALSRIWDKISRGVQFRYGIKKGFATIADHDYIDPKTGQQYNFVFPKGAIKGQVRANGGDVYTEWEKKNVELNIAGFSSVKEKKWGKLNYQFIQALNISWENLRKLATTAMKEIVKGLDNVHDAMIFLGMIASGEDDEMEQSFSTKLHDMLKANIRAFDMRWVRKQIAGLMKRTIENMRLGRIPVEDSRFVYIITDQNSLFKNGKPLLKSGECYFNGEVGERAVFRSPCIDKSEPKKINLVNRPELEEAFGHLKNILVINCFDDILPRAGGADTDGDKMYLTGDKIILDSIEDGLPMVFGDTKPKKKPALYAWGKDGHEAICQYDKHTLSPSQIGIVTDYCTALVDQARDPRTEEKKRKENWDLIVVGRDVQGKIIDSAKTGDIVPIPDSLKQNRFPHWLKDMTVDQLNNPRNSYEAERAEKVYESQSPMGLLYNYVVHRALPALEKKVNNTKTVTPKILNGLKYDLAEVEELEPAITVLEKNYRLEMDRFMKDNPESDSYHLSGEDLKSFMRDRRNKIRDLVKKHKLILNSLDYSAVSIAVACLHVAELSEDRRHQRACSYPYVVASECMEAMLAHIDGNYKLVALFNVDEDIWSAKVKVIDNKIYNWEGVPIASAHVEDGDYETVKLGDRYFIKFPIASQEVAERTPVEERQVQFTIKGWKFYDNSSSPEKIMELINSREVTTEVIVGESEKYGKREYVALVLDGKRLATLGEESDIVAFNIISKSMKVVGTKKYKGIIMVDAMVTGDVVKPENITVVETEVSHTAEFTDEDVPAELDEEFGFFGM